MASNIYYNLSIRITTIDYMYKKLNSRDHTQNIWLDFNGDMGTSILGTDELAPTYIHLYGNIINYYVYIHRT